MSTNTIIQPNWVCCAACTCSELVPNSSNILRYQDCWYHTHAHRSSWVYLMIGRVSVELWRLLFFISFSFFNINNDKEENKKRKHSYFFSRIGSFRVNGKISLIWHFPFHFLVSYISNIYKSVSLSSRQYLSMLRICYIWSINYQHKGL